MGALIMVGWLAADIAIVYLLVLSLDRGAARSAGSTGRRRG